VWFIRVGDVLEDEGGALAGGQLERGADVAVVQLDRGLGLQRQTAVRAFEQHAMLVSFGAVALAPVVESRRALQLDVHSPADGHDATDEPLAACSCARLPNRHEVLDFAHSLGREEARDEHVGVGEVQLLGLMISPSGPEGEAAPALGVEDRSEHARRVEAWAAVPIDRAIGADKGDRVQVTDHSMLGDG